MAVVNNEHSKKVFSCARLVCIFFILVCSFLVVQSLSSHYSYAATWPVSGKAQLSCSLEFHKQYVRAGKTYMHQGIDISASAGEDILAPVSGTVSFVGSVPSGDSLVNGGGSGQTMKAISIKMSSGKVLTLSPVEGIAVKRGASVSEGEVIASLAESGDRSSLCTHLHLGLKMGKTYYDPMTLFSAVKSESIVPAK
jgi:murein DD-endopeptidase MepM/ murein hydrolase activator NlpD